jgi:dihydroneopterin aldolase
MDRAAARLQLVVPSTPSISMFSDTTSRSTTIVASRPDRIIVTGLLVDAYIGVYDFERIERQRVRFDVEVDTIDGYADVVRLTGAYVSYADIVEYIEGRAATSDHVELVETWAEDVAMFVLANELAVAVRVTVQKIDIFEAADGVGIAIERLRVPATPEEHPS